MYKPQTVTKSNFGGPKGGAKCVWSTDHKKLKVTLGESSYVFNASDLPISSFPSGEYYVQLSEDKKEVLQVRPNNGMFVVKVDRFVAKEGETPAPRTITAVEKESGKEYSYQIFSVILKIFSPKEYEGMEILFSPRYNFDAAEDAVQGKKVDVVAYSHPRSKYTPLLMDFCDATGVWDKGPMKFSTNIVPLLEKRIAQADKKFQVVLKDGWVVTIFSMPDVAVEEKEEQFETEPESETEFEAGEPEELKTEDEDDELNWE